MAKGRGSNEGTGKIKFRFVEFEMDGTDASLEEGLKSIAAALNRGMGPAGGGVKLIRHNGVDTSAIVPPEDTGEESAAESGEEEQTVAVAPKKSSGPRKVTPRKVVPDFKLDDVSPTLKEFAAEKAPGSDLKKYLVIAYWAKEYKGMDELTPDHFYTAYKHMGWSTPKDMVQPIRDLTRHENGKFSASDTPGNGRINHVGESAVVEMGKK